MIKRINLSERKRFRWRVLFDEGSWILGMYRPEYKSRDEISQLEKHDHPELFYLIKGDIILMLKEEKGRLKELPLEAGEAVIIDCWHNGYSPDGDGTAMVIERKDVKTEFRDL